MFFRLISIVEPTPIGPAEVGLTSRIAGSHFGRFEMSLMNFHTSSTGRSIITLPSIFTMLTLYLE
jgi:hypothetical protein